jgi:hypothetical protein
LAGSGGDAAQESFEGSAVHQGGVVPVALVERIQGHDQLAGDKLLDPDAGPKTELSQVISGHQDKG